MKFIRVLKANNDKSSLILLVEKVLNKFIYDWSDEDSFLRYLSYESEYFGFDYKALDVQKVIGVLNELGWEFKQLKDYPINIQNKIISEYKEDTDGMTPNKDEYFVVNKAVK